MNGTKMTVAKLKITRRTILGLTILSIVILMLLLTGCEGEEELGVTYYTPSWMPDGRIIANADYWYSRPPDLYHPTYWTTGRVNWVVLMNADGTHEQKLFKREHTTEIYPDPTGTKLAIGYRIYNLSGNILAVIPTRDEKYFSPYDWSPDGSKVIGTYEEGRIYVYDLNIKAIQLVAEGMAEDASWRYSPDGKMIVYFSRNNFDKVAKRLYLSIYNFENKSTSSMQVSGIRPKYIPQANQILVWDSDFKDTGHSKEDLDRSKQFLSVYDLQSLSLVKRFPKPDNVLAWDVSPDGRKIIYGVNNNIGIYIMDLESGKVTELKKTSSYAMTEKK